MAYVIILDDDFANVYHREKDDNLTFNHQYIKSINKIFKNKINKIIHN